MKIRAVRIPLPLANPHEREVLTQMSECDLCQADGMTDDEVEESDQEDDWMSEEMSLSEGENGGDKPKR